MVDTITGAAPRYTRRRRAEVRAAWVAARARNTLHHPVRLAVSCGTVFIAALVLLVLAPRDAERAAQEVPPLTARWRDTVPIVSAIDSATRAVAVAESTLAARRAAAARPTYVPRLDTLTTEEAATRDSLAALSADLAQLLVRADNSPLPQSYHALGESAALRTDSRVRVLLDSLADVEREREEFGAGGGVDPIFVALTARATAVGRAIEDIAQARQRALREAITRIQPTTTLAPEPVVIDTTTPLARRDSMRERRAAAVASLAEARRANADTDRRLREARARANLTAPPIAILAAALILGVTLGFATSLGIELANPRVSDMQEAERVAGARVLAVIRPRVVPPERARRKADQRLPPLIDPTSDAYRHLASHTTVAGSSHAIVTVTGDTPAVTGTIAANIAAVSANEMRSTLLVDADLADHPLTSILRLPASTDISSVLMGNAELTAAAVQSVVGRDCTLDVVSAGRDARSHITPSEADVLRHALIRSARLYELSVVVAPPATANDVRVGPAVVVCAHVAHTPVATLRTIVASLRDQGAHITGIVLWAAEAPRLEPPWIFETWFAASREQGTAPASADAS